MIKKTITYEDFEGNQRTEDFYFNLTKAELVDMETSIDGGFEKRVQKIIAAKDENKLIKIFKDLVLRSYGEKSPDGRRFMKTPAIREAFAQTPAYSEIFMELVTNAELAAQFINGILPKMDPAK